MAKNKCPHCGGGKASCKDSRPSPIANIIRRRIYECEACGYRFTTEEKIAAIEGGGVVLTESHMAVIFIKEVEALARKYFGDDGGGLRGSSPERYRYGNGGARRLSNRARKAADD